MSMNTVSYIVCDSDTYDKNTWALLKDKKYEKLEIYNNL